MEYIHSKLERGHLTEKEIREVLTDPDRTIEKNKKEATGDYLVYGKSQSGKQLCVVVILDNGDPYWSIVYNAWEVS